jgi:ubiquinone biosynthesis protein
LARLQYQITPAPFDAIKPEIERELGKPLSEVFPVFDPQPLAAASLAQVYGATLAGGAEVVVKIQRPGVRDLVRTDLEILKELAGVIADQFPALKALNPQDLVEEFGIAVNREMDFSTEGGNTDRLRRNLEPLRSVRVPRVYWEYTTDRLLVMERYYGLPADDIAGIVNAGVNPADVARRIVECFMRQVFVDGFFHADPHAGNVLVAANGDIQLIDCGAMGYLPADVLNSLGAILISFNTADYERIATEVLRLGAADELTDIARFKNDAAAVVGRYYAMRLRFMRIGTMFEELSVLANRNRVRLPRDLVLLAKTVMLVENVSRRLDPRLNFVEVAQPFAQQVVARRYSPVTIARGLGDGLNDLNYYLQEVPRDLYVLLKRLVRGGVKIELEHRHLTAAMKELDRSSNRLAFAFVLAAIIVSSALIFVAGVGPTVFGYSILGIVGFVVAAFLGLWLSILMLRAGRL